MHKSELEQMKARLGEQATLALDHGGKAVTAFVRALLLLGAVIFHGIAKGFTWADALVEAQTVQERKAA